MQPGTFRLSRFRHRIEWVVFLTGISALSGCGPKVRTDQSTALEVFGSARFLEIVQKPERVEACRLKDGVTYVEPTDKNYFDPIDNWAHYPTNGTPIKVPLDVGIRLTKSLTSKDSYLWGWAKACIPSYGVRLSYFRGGDRVDVYFCLDCDILVVAHGNDAVGSGSFDYAHNTILEEIKKLIPDDQAIQALQPKDRPSF